MTPAMETQLDHLAILAPNWVGDLVMATPVLEAACAVEHVGRVSVLVRGHLSALLRGGPVEEHLHELPGRGQERAALRELAPDGVLLLSNSFGSAWRAWRAGVPRRAGNALRGRRWLLTHAVLPPTVDGRRFPVPTAHVQRDVAGLFGITPPDVHPRLHVTASEQAACARLLGDAGLEPGAGYVVCTPGAAFGAAKLWPPERFARALDLLHERHGWRAVVTGGPAEDALVEQVARGCRHDAISLAGAPRDLGSLKPLIRDAQLLLVGDSGPRWVAAAFDVPCVSIMGPNVPELTATSLEHCSIVRRELECSPCAQRVCPLGHHRCMTEIEPEHVVAAAEQVLARAVSSSS